ncbi:MAG: protoporphyrinogen oxidase [Candidatus Hydrogenedentes bacterium]|nr:protoporphyrinogen oxidase [Candidatus Hydrogenedentota bacterium]
MSTAVIGGGISGLCLAHRLVHAHSQDDVVVLEASDYAGGHIRTEEVDGYLLDWGPNGFLDREPLMLEWVEELGLGGELIRANEASAHRFLLLGDQLRELKPLPAFLFSRLLSPLGIARLLREPLVRAKRDGAAESIWDFAARRIGPEAADTLVSAMVLGVYGGDAKALSLEHCFPRMAAMEREHGGLFKAMLAKRKGGAGTGSAMGPGGTLTSFNGGIGTLVKQVAQALGERVRTNARVEAIEQAGHGYRVRLEGGETLDSDKVVLALPAFAAAELSKAFDKTLSEALASIVYAPIAVVCTGYEKAKVRHNLDGFGYLVPPNQQKSVLGCIWTSSVFPQTTPDAKVQLRTMIGGALEPDAA